MTFVTATLQESTFQNTLDPFFRTSLIRVLVYREREFERRTNIFNQRAPYVLPEMLDRWLPTLVNTVFFQVSVSNFAVLNLVNSVNTL